MPFYTSSREYVGDQERCKDSELWNIWALGVGSVLWVIATQGS